MAYSPGLPPTVDVLVVGAGPTGLAMTIALTRLGVDVLALDAATGIRSESRAAGVQPRTLEDLARLDAADELVARGVRGLGFRATDNTQQLLAFPFTDLDTPYPFGLQVPQHETEQVLQDALTRAGGQLHRQHRVLSITPEHDAVTALVADPGGAVHAVRARYLVGCDGLHSGVRTQAGIDFAGADQPQRYLLADAAVTGLDGPPQVTFTFASDGLLLLSQLPHDLMRIVASIPVDHEDFDRAAIQHLLDARAPAGATLTVTDVVHSGPYSVSTRLAGRFRAGRVFLAGDAAHVHSPAGGQGMNTGIQDALNLAWKLAAVIGDGAGDRLLGTYDAERRPNAAALLAFTQQLTSLAGVTAPAAESLRNKALLAVRDIPELSAFLANRLAQLDIHYAQPVGGHPLVGRRLPPGRGYDPVLGWVVLVPDALQSAAQEAAGSSAVVLVQPRDEAVLIRPDRYVAAAVDIPGDGAGAASLVEDLMAAMPGKRPT